MYTLNRSLKQFLIFAARQGYANSETIKKQNQDGSETISLIKDKFRFDDNYFTSEDGRRFHGREIVYLNEKPYWFMGYSGFVENDANPSEVYRFLKKAMLNPMDEFPVRGPKELLEDNWRYQITDITGDLSQFTAVEHINLNSRQVYNCYFIGGIID
ncbi:MAG: hypothetical protein QG675_38 [Patescibacteria group bacterium]|jgi:hypothetical protein|nr:hypothetical protein [Patescibacteria group bacterium]